MRRWLVLIVIASCSEQSAPKPRVRRDVTPVVADAPALGTRLDVIETSNTPVTYDVAVTQPDAGAQRGVLRITTGKREILEGLPASQLGAGEFPQGCWVAPDGSVYVVGKQYTGDGPDGGPRTAGWRAATGAVWKRDAKGDWTTQFRLPRRSFGTIAGNAQQIVIGTLGGYVVFDGARWSVHRMPYEAVQVWSEDGQIFGQDFDGTVTFAIENGEARLVTKRAKKLWRTDVETYGCEGGGVKYFAYSTSR